VEIASITPTTNECPRTEAKDWIGPANPASRAVKSVPDVATLILASSLRKAAWHRRRDDRWHSLEEMGLSGWHYSAYYWSEDAVGGVPGCDLSCRVARDGSQFGVICVCKVQ
jgi:hypothetical protein